MTLRPMARSDAHQIYAMRGFSTAAVAGRPEPPAGGDVFLGMTTIYNEGNAPTVDCELSMSTDTVHWTRIAPGMPFLPRGPPGSYDAGLSYCGSVPFEMNGTMAILAAGGKVIFMLPCIFH